MKIGYARISTREQSLQLQIDALKEAGCEKIYQEVASGSKTARVVLDDLMDHIRSGDILIVWKLDRLGRNLSHLLYLVDEFKKRNISFISLQDNFDTTTPQGMLLLTLFGMVAEFERGLTVERTKAGLAAARALGRVGGRRSWESMGGVPKEVQEKARVAEILYTSGDVPISAIAKQLGIAKPTMYRYLRMRGVRINEPIQKIINFRNKNKIANC